MTRRVSPAEVVDALHAIGTVIPDDYYLGTAKHESGFDIENDTPEPNGTHSYGLYQINDSEIEEAIRNGHADSSVDNRFDLYGNTNVFIYLAERNRNKIRDALGLGVNDSDPPGMGGWLAMAHNAGYATAVKYATKYGGDWSGWLANNANGAATDWPARISRYGSDCLYDPSNVGQQSSDLFATTNLGASNDALGYAIIGLVGVAWLMS